MLRFGGKIGKGKREKVVQAESQEQRTAVDNAGCERVGQTRPKNREKEKTEKREIVRAI
jgi:hypothetical protein